MACCKYCGKDIYVPPEVDEGIVSLDKYIGSGIDCPRCHAGLGIDDLISEEEYIVRELVGDEVAEKVMEWTDDWEYALELVEDIEREIDKNRKNGRQLFMR